MNIRKPKSQVDELIYELLQKTHTTSLTMHLNYFISNVPDVVFRARNKGYAIETKNEERSNKFGRKISIAKWILNDKDNALKMYNEG